MHRQENSLGRSKAIMLKGSTMESPPHTHTHLTCQCVHSNIKCTIVTAFQTAVKNRRDG